MDHLDHWCTAYGPRGPCPGPPWLVACPGPKRTTFNSRGFLFSLSYWDLLAEPWKNSPSLYGTQIRDQRLPAKRGQSHIWVEKWGMAVWPGLSHWYYRPLEQPEQQYTRQFTPDLRPLRCCKSVSMQIASQVSVKEWRFVLFPNLPNAVSWGWHSMDYSSSRPIMLPFTVWAWTVLKL